MAVKIPFTVPTIKKCLCPSCPVQAKSSCVAGLKKNLAGALAKDPLERKSIPAVYCSTGKATCTDIDPSKDCLCGGCPVFIKYDLGTGQPGGYYCREGSAH